MIVKAINPFIMHIPVTGNQIADSTHTISHWGVVGLEIETRNGLCGYGFTGTHAHLPSDQLIAQCIETCYAPLLEGEDLKDVNRIWAKMTRHPAMQWVGRAGITTLAMAAIDIALWDLKAKAVERPLWSLLGGQVRDKVRAYNTDVGWLSISDKELVNGALRAVQEGFTGIKVKVGSTVERDLRRLDAVRRAIGPDVTLAVDGNGKWDLPTCMRFCKGAEGLDLLWFEEPLWHDDVKGHAQLAQSSRIPIALGEQLYSQDAFAEFFHQNAIHWVQPDVTRMAGITEVWRVCEMAYSHRLPVAPHAGDMSQVHVHLSYAHPACQVLEYIPWIKDAFTDPAQVVDGHFVLPQEPGAGTTPTYEAAEQFSQPLR